METKKKGALTRFGDAFSVWSNRWVPGSLVFVFALTVIIILMALGLCKVPFFTSTKTATSVVDAWVKGFWSLLTFSMQMCLIMITGDVLANAPVIKRFITRVAKVPKNQLQALVLLSIIVFITRWIHWGFGMMVGIVLGREILAQCKVKGVAVHKVSMAAACYCITCATIGISTSGPLYVAGSGWLASYVPAAYKSLVPDVVPLSETVLLPAIIIQCLLLGALTVLLVYAMMPKNAADILEISDDFANEIINASKPAAAKVDRKSMTPSQRMNTSIWLNLIVGGLGLAYSVKMLAVSGIVNLSVNNFNFIMLMLGVLLHKTPASFGKAVSAAVGSVSGVIIQFPFYAGIYGVVSFTGLTGVIADFFVAISNARTFPAITFVYSAILNFFVPSAGSKFIIEVPYIIPTAIDLGSSIPAVINAYSFGDYATNLIQPFWALPILGMFKLDFKDIIPYGFVMCVVASVVTILFALFLY